MIYLKIMQAHLRFTLRRSMMIFILFIQPVLFVGLSYYIYKDSSLTDIGSKIFIAGALTNFWACIVFSSISDVERERWMGTLELIFASPLGFKHTQIAKTIACLLLGLIPAVIAYLLILLIGLELSFAAGLKSLIAAVVLIAFMFSLSLCLSCFFAISRNSRVVMNAFEYPFFVLSGFVFPISMLPQGLYFLAVANPLTYPVALFRQAVIGEKFYLSWDLLLLVSITLTSFFFILALWLFKKIENYVRISCSFSLV